MGAPLLKDWSELDRMRLDAAHPWFDRYRRQLKIFAEGSAEKFAISHFILFLGWWVNTPWVETPLLFVIAGVKERMLLHEKEPPQIAPSDDSLAQVSHGHPRSR